jgi:hypothetical protein
MYGAVHKRLDKFSLWYYWGHTLAAVHHSCTDVCVNIKYFVLIHFDWTQRCTFRYPLALCDFSPCNIMSARYPASKLAGTLLSSAR